MLQAGIDYLRTKTIKDEYIDWLTFANAGMLHKGNIYAMNLALENLPSAAPVLEIGSFCGLSANVISYLLSRHGKNNVIFNCDRWIFEGAENGGNLGKSNISHDKYRDFIKSSYLKNTEFFSSGNMPYTIEKFSAEFFELWEKRGTTTDVFGRNIRLGGEISFCYIDGNHTYQYAKQDFDNIDKHLTLGGYILFDDSSDADPFGLTRLMKEIKKNRRYELVIKNPNYLFRRIV
jgi:hypothetical protein